MIDRRTLLKSGVALAAASALVDPLFAAIEPDFKVHAGKFMVSMEWDNEKGSDFTISTFEFHDEKVRRPFFTIPGRTRNRPLQKGDAEDHEHMHPGIWLAFGDLNGHDFWRNKGRVVHEGFPEEPDGSGREYYFKASFTSRHRYETADGTPVARESLRCRARTLNSKAWLLEWDSFFEPLAKELVFGDQEEMGLGIRIATKLTVKNGGTILNSAGQKDERECWGQLADWCLYSKDTIGVMLIAHPDNFKKSTFHVRDYGLMVANPFAEQAFRRSDTPAKTVVKAGDKLRLRFGIVIFQGEKPDPAARYKEYLKIEKHQ